MFSKYLVAEQLHSLMEHSEARVDARRAVIADRRAQPHTRKKCPACGEKPSYSWQPKDRVCDKCLAEIWRAQDIIDLSQKRDGIGSERLEIQSDWPRIMSLVTTAKCYDPEIKAATEAIEAALHGLVTALVADRLDEPGRKATRVPSFKNATGWYDRHALCVLAPSGTKEALAAVVTALDQPIRAIYEAGVDYGRMLIAQLAAGDITVDQFDAGKRIDRR